MATNTKNYNLIKPDADDFYDVNQFNQNADIIDSQLKNNADSIEAIRINDLTALPPVETTLNSGESTLTTEHDSTARVKAFEGDTIVNYVPLFDSGAWSLNTADFTIRTPSILFITSTVSIDSKRVKIPVKPNTQYTLSGSIIGSGYAYLSYRDVNDTQISISTSITNSRPSVTVTTPTNATSVYVFLEYPSGEHTFVNISLNEGAKPKPFVPNVQGVTNPTIENTTTGDSITLLGTFHKGDVVSEDKVQYSVLRAKKEVVLDGNLPWVHSNVGIDYKIASVNLGINGVAGSEKVVKYNGKILPIVGSDWTKGDEVQLWTNSNVSTLYISAPNADTGFGPDYVPTADEWKAYFFGWEMGTLVNGSFQFGYNGTGTKYWRAKNITLTGSGVVPTIAIDTWARWKPYKLLCELVIPVREPVQAINSVLKLAKGDNSLEVSEGRIIREYTIPYHYKYSSETVKYDRYEINTDSKNPLKFKAKKILNVYKNGEVDKNWTFENAEYGMRALLDASLFNETAVYTVDYEPLYPFEVTAPLNNISMEYQSNLVSVVNQNVEDIVQLKEDVAVIERDMVRKGEGVEWLTPVLLNGVTGDVKISKDANNIVDIRAQLTLPGVIETSAPLFYVPKGFRPYTGVPNYNTCTEYTSNTDAKTILIGISSTDGGVRPGFATLKPRLSISIRYRAGQ